MGGPTNCLWAALWRPPHVLIHASPQQRERNVLPYTRDGSRGCYAIDSVRVVAIDALILRRSDRGAPHR